MRKGRLREATALFFGSLGIMLYFCTLYGTELYLDCIFPHRVRCCAGEVSLFRRRHGISRYDGFHVLLVEDRL